MFPQMFPSFATREILFPTAKNVSVSRQKHFFAYGYIVSGVAKLGNIGNYLSAANISANMFPRFSKALLCRGVG